MSEEKDKKIHFKILTAEHLIEEKPAETKKVEPPPKEEIKPKVIETIEVTKEEIPPKPLKEEKITIEPKSSTGLHYPAEENIPPAPKIPSIDHPSPITQPTTPPQPPKESLLEKTPEPEIFYQPKKEEPKPEPKQELIKEEPKIFYKPTTSKTTSFSLGEIIKEQPFEEKSEKKSLLLRYALLGSGVLLIPFLIFFFKPYEKLKVFFVKKETFKKKVVPEIQPEIIIPQPKITTIPEIIATSSPIPKVTIEKQPPPLKETIIPQPEVKTEFLKQTSLFQTKEFSFVNNFYQKEIKLKELNSAEFEKQIKNLLSNQEIAGALFNLNFTFNNQKIPFNFVFDYFIKPSKISSQEINNFKNEFTGNFAFILYYTYTRKYPLLILEIKNPSKVKLFNEKWEKMSMNNDLKTLFLGIQPGKPLKNYFITKEVDGLAYRVFYFDNNYKVIWAIVNNFLIYSATENGLKEIASYIK